MRLLNEALSRLVTWTRRDEGQTLVEYGLIVALISVVAIAVLILVGADVAAVFQKIADTINIA